MAIDRDRIAAAVREILAAIGEDVTREGLRETPTRVADAMSELYAGVGEDPTVGLRDAASTADVDEEVQQLGAGARIGREAEAATAEAGERGL